MYGITAAIYVLQNIRVFLGSGHWCPVPGWDPFVLDGQEKVARSEQVGNALSALKEK